MVPNYTFNNILSKGVNIFTCLQSICREGDVVRDKSFNYEKRNVAILDFLSVIIANLVPLIRGRDFVTLYLRITFLL